jgi:hypothetical protein
MRFDNFEAIFSESILLLKNNIVKAKEISAGYLSSIIVESTLSPKTKSLNVKIKPVTFSSAS